MPANNFLSEEQWEAVWFVNIIMSYYNLLEREGDDKRSALREDEIDERITSIENKLDKILDKLEKL